MRRSVAWLWLLLPALALGQEIDPAKVQIEVEKVQGSVYMLIGTGGSIGVSIGGDGIVTVDDQFRDARPMRRACRGR